MTRVVVLAPLVALAACSSGSAPKPNVPFASLKGDAARGATAFNACRSCHSVEPGGMAIGPTMHGVVGRMAGTLPGYTYSDAMKAHGRVWSEQHLYDFLLAPQQVVVGTKMGYGGMADPQMRADVVTYLATLR